MEKGKIYHVIDSIKGGCGKTTFSIMLTEYLEKKGDVNEHACLLDVDFLGTGMQALFLGKEALHNFKSNHIFLTDKIRKPGEGTKKFVYCAEIEGEKLYVAFSDPGYRAKQEYRLTSRSNYTPIVKYGVFRAGVHSILDGDKLDEEISGTVKDVILDMSPSCDAYSESIKDCLFDKKHSNCLVEDDLCNYYLMVGTDASHISAAIGYLRDFLESDGKLPHRIFIVFNDIMQIIEKCTSEEGMTPEQHYDTLKQDFEEMLGNYGEKITDRIFFLGLNPFNNYALKTHTRIPLCTLKSTPEKDSIFLATPFRYAARYGENFRVFGTGDGKSAEQDNEEVFAWIKNKSKEQKDTM